MKTDSKRAVRIGDEAVRARTGKTWPEWFAALDRTGARQMDHKTLAAYLHKERGLPSWWAQMVSVGYEQACGKREKHEKPSGYEISRSVTVAVPASRLFAAWQDVRLRRRWLKDPDFVVRKATPPKSLRITWGDGKTNLDVGIFAKSRGKSMVAVQHGKLADSKHAERMKAYWGEQLASLKKLLEA